MHKRTRVNARVIGVSAAASRIPRPSQFAGVCVCMCQGEGGVRPIQAHSRDDIKKSARVASRCTPYLYGKQAKKGLDSQALKKIWSCDLLLEGGSEEGFGLPLKMWTASSVIKTKKTMLLASVLLPCVIYATIIKLFCAPLDKTSGERKAGGGDSRKRGSLQSSTVPLEPI